MQKAVWGWLKRVSGRYLVNYVLLGIAGYFLLIWRLGRLTPGISPAESAARSGAKSLSAIYHNPVNAPQRLLEHLCGSVFNYSHFSIRLASAFMAVIFAVCFYRLVLHWFGRSVGFFGAIIFVTTPLLVIAGRQASAEIMYLAPVGLMAAYLWLHRAQKYKPVAWIVLCVVSAIFIYTPGMLWWLMAAAIICRRRLQAELAEIPSRMAAVGLALAILVILPLIAATISDWQIIKDIFLFPRHFQGAVRILKNVAWMGSSLVYRLPRHIPLSIGSLPVLNIAQVALLAFGVYAMWTAAKAKTYTLAASIILAIVLAGLNDNPVILLLGLPAIGIFISAGLRYLYIEWRGIFPANPIAKSLAIALIAAAVAGHVLYGVRYSLIAWPQTIETKTTYVLK